MADEKKFDLTGLVKNVRSVMDPEYNIPADEQNNPINYRIMRIKALLDELKQAQLGVNQKSDQIEANLNGLLEILNGEKPQASAPKKAEEAPAEPAKGEEAKHDEEKDSDK